MVRGFFRGLGFPLASYGVINSIFFGVYGNTIQKLTSGLRKPTYSEVFAAGCVGGMAQLVVACPVDVVKVVLQSQIPAGRTAGQLASSTPAHKQVFYKGPVECVGQMLKQRNALVLYRSLPTMFLRDVPASAIYFVSFEVVRDMLDIRGIVSSSSVASQLFCGGLAGMISWTAILPFDVVKSKLQADVFGKQFRGFFDCAHYIYRTLGIRAFFTGVIVTNVRAFPVNAVTLTVYLQVLPLLEKYT